MKRFHVHVHVSDLDASVSFYSRLFGAAPSRVERDYAKWMLDDPRLNFAISARGGVAGVDHLGFQADDEAELADLRERARAAGAAVLDEGETTCCYARSDKHWTTDPQGVAWEQFHTLGDIPTFGTSKLAATPGAGACCTSASPTPTAGRAATDEERAAQATARATAQAPKATTGCGCAGGARAATPSSCC